MSLKGKHKVGDWFEWEGKELIFRGYGTNGFFASDKLGQRFFHCPHYFVVKQQAPSSGVALMRCKKCGVEIVEEW